MITLYMYTNIISYTPPIFFGLCIHTVLFEVISHNDDLYIEIKTKGRYTGCIQQCINNVRIDICASNYYYH